MDALEQVAAAIPEAARDIRINLDAVLRDSALNDDQRWGVAVAAAIAARQPALRDALAARAATVVSAGVIEDAQAAAALMAMNNIFYRFRHVVGKPGYNDRPARLRMQRIAKPATNKRDFELFCLAVSAINNCEACVRSHEAGVITAGFGEEHVQDAIRIAATVVAAAVALDSASLSTGA